MSLCAVKLICFDVECNKIRISLEFRCFPSYFFFHSSFNQANLSNRACKDVFHKKIGQALMSSTTTVAIETISHLHVVSNYSKMSHQYGTVENI